MGKGPILLVKATIGGIYFLLICVLEFSFKLGSVGKIAKHNPNLWNFDRLVHFGVPFAGRNTTPTLHVWSFLQRKG